jgi:hypothetical protein
MADWFGYAYIHELPDDGSQEHEVYARFGLAAYAAQTFEIGMVNLLTVAGLTEATAANSMDEQFGALMGKTAGALLREVHEAGHLSDDERETCRAALKCRNSTVHGFFYRHAADYQHPAGRQTMVEEADAARMTRVRVRDSAPADVGAGRTQGHHPAEGPDLHGRASRDFGRRGTRPS